MRAARNWALNTAIESAIQIEVEQGRLRQAGPGDIVMQQGRAHALKHMGGGKRQGERLQPGQAAR